MANYFRITGYFPGEDFCFILDSNGMFEKLWQFSSYIISKGLKVLSVSSMDKLIDINIKPADECKDKVILRAHQAGQPEYTAHEIDGIKYKAIKVNEKLYIPDKTKII